MEIFDFGDGEYQIVKYTENSGEMYELYNVKYNLTLMKNVQNYFDETI